METSRSSKANPAAGCGPDAAWDLSAVAIQRSIGTPEQRQAGVSTHLSVWPGAHHLCNYLSSHCKEVFGNGVAAAEPRTINILELGAGTGWLGLTVASNLRIRAARKNLETETHAAASGAENAAVGNIPVRYNVTMTELAAAVPALRKHVSEFENAAAAADGPGPVSVSVRECDWSKCVKGSEEKDDEDMAALLGTHWDVIIGSELVWNSAGASALPHAFRAFYAPAETATATKPAGCPATHILYAHQPQYSPAAHKLFLDGCDACGLVLEPLNRELPEAGATASEAPTAPASDGASNADSEDECNRFFQDIFPFEGVYEGAAGRALPRFTIYDVSRQAVTA